MLNIKINPLSDKPIYKQIVEQVKYHILSGKLEADEKLISSRNLAIELKINALTIQKAYQELKTQDLIYYKRGEGTFVKEVEQVSDHSIKIKEIEKKITELFDLSETYSVPMETVLELWEKEVKKRS